MEDHPLARFDTDRAARQESLGIHFHGERTNASFASRMEFSYSHRTGKRNRLSYPALSTQELKRG